MKKKFGRFELNTIKGTARMVNPIVVKKERLAEKIAELQAEYDDLSAQQDAYESNVKRITGGYTTDDLVEKVVETTNSVDKNGKPIKVTKYVLKYPETIVPPAMEGTDPEEVDGEAEAPVVEEEPSDAGAFDPTFGASSEE